VRAWWRYKFFFQYFWSGFGEEREEHGDAGGREWEQSKTHFEQPERQPTHTHAGAKRGYGCHMHRRRRVRIHRAEWILAAGSESGSRALGEYENENENENAFEVDSWLAEGGARARSEGVELRRPANE
jgi:hypothetical protein